MTEPKPITARYKEQASKAAGLVRRFTMPVFRLVGAGTPEFEGTGLLVDAGRGHRFLVSAAHVFDACGDGVFLLFPGREDLPLTNLPMKTSLPPSGRREDDAIDLGFVLLTDEEVAAVGEDAFVRAHHFGARDALVPGRGVYIALGYPEGSQARDHRRSIYGVGQTYYWAPEAKAKAYSEAKLARDFHVLIAFNQRRVMGPKGAGGAPSFRGMSGAGVWRLKATEEYRPDNLPRLVGVFLGKPRSLGKVLVGTRIELLLEAFRRSFPELDSSLPSYPQINVNFATASR